MTGWMRPPTRGVRWRIVEAPAKGALTVWLLSETPYGVWIHWTGRACCLCASQELDPPERGQCVWCGAGQRREWRGQCAALSPPKKIEEGGIEVVFRFPASLGRELAELYDRALEQGRPGLRGLVLDVERCTPRDGGRGVKVREVRGRGEVPAYLPTINMNGFVGALYKPANDGFAAGGGVS